MVNAMHEFSDPSVLVLASLAERSKHGYLIMQDVKSVFGVRLGPGTLYGAITRLEERGLIAAAASKGRQRPYRITAAGRRYLANRLKGLSQLVNIGLRRLETV